MTVPFPTPTPRPEGHSTNCPHCGCLCANPESPDYTSPGGCEQRAGITPPAPSTRDGVPVLPGFIDQRARAADLRVWCLWCCHWHTHGAVPVGTVVHRLAHCYAPDSAYRQGGYWIDVSSRPYREVAKSVRPATAAQQRAMCGGRVSSAVQRLRDQPPPESA